MKHGKDVRNSKGQSTEPNAPNEVPVLMFVMVEKSPGAFTLRSVVNEDLIGDLRAQGALKTFLADADEFYANFRDRFEQDMSRRPN